ncbi:MAG: pilus assembly protein PilM [Candidatus Binatia bacterium]
MPQRVLALEVDACEVKAAVLETTFRDYRVVGFYREPFVSGDPPLPEQLQAFLQRHQLGASAVLSSLAGDLVTLRTFFLPFRDRKRLDQTVPFELEAQVPFGLDDVIVDYQVLHRDRAGCNVLAALVQRCDLEAHLAVLSAAGLDPKVIDFAPLATLNVLGLLGEELPNTFAYVGGNARRTIVALYRNRRLVGLRTLVNVPATPTETAVAAADNGHQDAGSAASVVGDIRWTLLALNGAPLEAGLPCVVAGDGEEFDLVAQALGGAMDLAVRRLDQAVVRHVPPALHTTLGSFVAPLGLALREVAPNDALGLNFRRGEFAYHRGEDELRYALWRTGAIAGLALALVVANTYMTYRQAASRLEMIQGQIRSVFTQTLPDVHRIRDERAQLQAEIDAAQKKLDVLGGLVPEGGVTAIDVMRTIAAAIPDTIKIDADEYLMDPESVRIRAKTDSFEAVDTVKQQLLNTQYFADVQVKDVKSTPDGRVDFRLALTLGKAGTGAPSAR